MPNTMIAGYLFNQRDPRSVLFGNDAIGAISVLDFCGSD
jgi:hypothetical protein